jgi:hypothetical protein
VNVAGKGSLQDRSRFDYQEVDDDYLYDTESIEVCWTRQEKGCCMMMKGIKGISWIRCKEGVTSNEPRSTIRECHVILISV